MKGIVLRDLSVQEQKALLRKILPEIDKPEIRLSAGYKDQSITFNLRVPERIIKAMAGLSLIGRQIVSKDGFELGVDIDTGK